MKRPTRSPLAPRPSLIRAPPTHFHPLTRSYAHTLTIHAAHRTTEPFRQVMYLALSNVHPITLAVGNTLKRVVIIVASLIAFRNPITPAAAVGSTIGIAGTLLYSLVNQHYNKLDAAKKA